MKQSFRRIPFYAGMNLPGGSISISRSGRIGLTAQFAKEHGITAGDRAALYWDDAKDRLAIVFTTSNDRTAYPLASTGSKSGMFISAIKFFRAVGIDPSQYAGRYEYEPLAAEDAGLIDVDANVDANADVFIVRLDRSAARRQTDGLQLSR